MDCYPEQLAPGSASAAAGAAAYADAEDAFMETPQMQTQQTPRLWKASLLYASAANAATGAAADADAEDAFMESPQMQTQKTSRRWRACWLSASAAAGARPSSASQPAEAKPLSVLLTRAQRPITSTMLTILRSEAPASRAFAVDRFAMRRRLRRCVCLDIPRDRTGDRMLGFACSNWGSHVT